MNDHPRHRGFMLQFAQHSSIDATVTNDRSPLIYIYIYIYIYHIYIYI